MAFLVWCLVLVWRWWLPAVVGARICHQSRHLPMTSSRWGLPSSGGCQSPVVLAVAVVFADLLARWICLRCRGCPGGSSGGCQSPVVLDLLAVIAPKVRQVIGRRCR